jgi:hypothetical protein
LAAVVKCEIEPGWIGCEVKRERERKRERKRERERERSQSLPICGAYVTQFASIFLSMIADLLS